MQFRQDISLKPYNTFGIDVRAEYFMELADVNDLYEISETPHRLHILGGGSNVLLTGNVGGVVVRNVLQGIDTIKEDDHHVWLQVQAGEVWHNLVLHTIANGWGGIENLALIPGTVGASPIQNIGAYGVEARAAIEQVNCWHLAEKSFMVFSNEACSFGYRDSIFKHSLKDKVFVTSVVFKLNKRPVLNTSYGAIEQELAAMGVQTATVQTIAQAVINIRSSKLPDPRVTGNAGSFFKNPTIPVAAYQQLLNAYPAMPHFAVDSDRVKVPAAWLIEQCGWKGYKKGDIGVHDRQALVLVNYGNADGNELWHLSGEIVTSVNAQFGIELEREVQVW